MSPINPHSVLVNGRQKDRALGPRLETASLSSPSSELYPGPILGLTSVPPSEVVVEDIEVTVVVDEGKDKVTAVVKGFCEDVVEVITAIEELVVDVCLG